MKTTEQRIAVLHQRAGQLRRRQEKAILSGLASLSLLLFILLVRLGSVFSGHSGEITGDAFTAASLLDESIGGYVLAAVVAFMAGVSITVVVIRYRNRNEKNGGRKNGKTSGN